MTYYVYVLASGKHGTLYVGVTNSVGRRVAEHKAKQVPGFTKRYGVDRLVFHRSFGEVTAAIKFEKQLKRWRRDWKIRLIEEDNPHWDDLYLQMMREPPLHPALMGPGLPPAAETGMTAEGEDALNVEDDLRAAAEEELDRACSLSWRELAKVTPWGDTYEGITPDGRDVCFERAYLWQGDAAIRIEVMVYQPDLYEAGVKLTRVASRDPQPESP